MLWTPNSCCSPMRVLHIKADSQLFSCSTDCLDSHATEICEFVPLKTSSQTLFKCIKPFLPTTDVGLYTAFLKVSDNETER